MLVVFVASGTGATQPSTPRGRLTVAVLWFADKTADPQMSHWRCAISRLLSKQLAEAKAVRVLPSGAVDYAFRQLALKKGSAFDAGQARKMGELIEAQRVVWGSYDRQNEQWQVRAFVLNVAGGKASGELIVSSADWFELRDELAGQILRELGVKPSESERQKMTHQWTTSPAALESYSRAIELQEDNKPFREQEESLRKALAVDPQLNQGSCWFGGGACQPGKVRRGGAGGSARVRAGA